MFSGNFPAEEEIATPPEERWWLAMTVFKDFVW